MDTPVPSADARVKSPRARQFLRSPVLFASIQLSDLNGFILNASEGGLCVQIVREIPRRAGSAATFSIDAAAPLGGDASAHCLEK